MAGRRNRASSSTTDPPPKTGSEAARVALSHQADAIADRYAPAYILIDEAYDVLRFSGRTGRFLEPSGGIASLNLLNLVSSDLRAELLDALREAGGEEAVARRDQLRLESNGEPRWTTIIVEPVRTERSGGQGYLVFFQDGGPIASPASPTARTERALARTEARYKLILDSSTDYAIIVTDEAGVITEWNSGAENILGWTSDEAVGRRADIIFTPEDRKAGAPQAEMAKADTEMRAADERWHLPRDGSRFWGQGMMTPMRDGPLSGYLKILRDRTDDREAAERQKMLLAELQHRVRNLLSVVRSMASRTVENSRTLHDFAENFDGRLSTLARTQNILTRSSDVTLELGELVRDELLSVGAHDGAQASVDGPVVRLRENAAETFALAIHELTTNALKYGALSRPDGRLSIVWRVFNTRQGKRLSLEWREEGVPTIDLAPARKGFGRDLIEHGLPYELGAATALEFRAGGLRAVIEMPLDEKIAVITAVEEG